MTIKSFWAAGLTGLTLAAFTGLAAAQGIKLEHDSSAPMKFGSDGAVVDNANCVRTMTGRAEFEQDRSRLRANEARMIQAKDKGRCGEVTRLEVRDLVRWDGRDLISGERAVLVRRQRSQLIARERDQLIRRQCAQVGGAERTELSARESSDLCGGQHRHVRRAEGVELYGRESPNLIAREGAQLGRAE